jgi:hypothetical protein
MIEIVDDKVYGKKVVAAQDLPAETVILCEDAWLPSPERTTSEPPEMQLTKEFLKKRSQWEETRRRLVVLVESNEANRVRWTPVLEKHDSNMFNLSHALKKLKAYDWASKGETKSQRWKKLGKQFHTSPDLVKTVHALMVTNAFGPGCFLSASYFNHSCNHNAMVLFGDMIQNIKRMSVMPVLDSQLENPVPSGCADCNSGKESPESRLHVMLNQDVKKGDHITINYEALLKDAWIQKDMVAMLPLCYVKPSTKKRRQHLEKRFGFQCKCSECK